MKSIKIGNTYIGMGGNPSDEVIENTVRAVFKLNGGSSCSKPIKTVCINNILYAQVSHGQSGIELVPIASCNGGF